MSNKLFKGEDPNRDTRPMWEQLGFSSEDHMTKTYEMRVSIEKALRDARFDPIDRGIGYGQAHIQYEYEGDEYVIVLKMCSGKELGGHWLQSKCASGEPPMI